MKIVDKLGVWIVPSIFIIAFIIGCIAGWLIGPPAPPLHCFVEPYCHILVIGILAIPITFVLLLVLMFNELGGGR
jgi:hypothetical protein